MGSSQARAHSGTRRSGRAAHPAGDHEKLAGAYASAAYLALNEDSLSEAIELLNSAKQAGNRMDRPFSTMIIYGSLGLAHLLTGEVMAARRPSKTGCDCAGVTRSFVAHPKV